ncbi:TRI16 protein, partial [Polypterus senegalus]
MSKQKQLGVTLSDIKRGLEEREKTLKETRRAMDKIKISVVREVEENKKSFTALIRCFEEAHRKLTERIKEQEKREMEKAEGVMEQLEKEIEELKRREAELKELSKTKDHLHFLQTFSSHCVLPADGDSLSFTVTADFSFEDLRKELSGLTKSLEKISQGDFMTGTPSAHEAPVFALQPPEPQSRDDFLKYFCPLTLDINTAHRYLRLSERNKKVTREGTETEYPDHPERFDRWPQVLCREALTGTRCYWEVECSGDFMLIGVTYKGMSRKGEGRECSLGYNDKSWKLTERIREQEKREMEKAEGVMEQLEKEIEELKRREAELKELSETKDHLHFLQTFSSRCVLPADGDSLSFTVTADFSSEDLRKELSGLTKSLEKISQWDIMTRTPSAHEAPVFALQPPEPQSRDDFLKYFCPLTLDINTARRDLRLSEGNKKLTCERTKTKYPDHPDRFDHWQQVLCREALTGTRCYWEVECSGDVMRIGVAYKGLGRKGLGGECLFGNNDKSWCLLWSHSQYSVLYNNQQTVISAPYSPTIGTYVLAAYASGHDLRGLFQIKVSVVREVEENEKSFTALIRCIEETHRKLTERIREQEKRETEKAEGVMEQLEKEIEDLKRGEAKLKELLETKDHLHFLQTFSSRCVLPANGDSLSFTVTAEFSSEDLRKELSGLTKSLEKISQWVTMTRTPSAPVFALQPPEPQSRDDFLKYFCPLTLDINTAHRKLRLSEGNKKVTREGTETEYPDHPDRFDYWTQVLCREPLTGTRCYWEMECSGDFMRIGVAYKGLRRKGWGGECGLGYNDKSWCLRWSHFPVLCVAQ